MAPLEKLPLIAIFTILYASEGQNTPWNHTPAPAMTVSDELNYDINHTNNSSFLLEENATVYNYSRTYPTISEDYIFCLFPIIFLGLCGNVVNIVVWNAEPAFKPTTFFMKCLAVSDILLLLSFFFHSSVTGYDGNADVVAMILVMSVLCWFRILSAHTTLAVVFTRWLAVYRPMKVSILLTKRRVVAGFILIILWSLTALVPFFVVTIQDCSTRVTFVIINITEIIYLALPIVLLIVLNVHMVWRLQSRMSSFREGWRVARASDESDHHRLCLAILCLSITTVLAYPLGVLSRIFLNITLQHVYITSASTMLSVSMILEAFNASINVVYYLLFVSRFRQLFRRRCCCCCCCCGKKERQHKSLETGSASLETYQ